MKNSHLTTQETAQYCGVSIRSIERWRMNKNDPFPEPVKIKPGPQKHYLGKDVAAWMNRNFERSQSA